MNNHKLIQPVLGFSLAAALVVALWPAQSILAGVCTALDNSHDGDQDLAVWQDVYFRWFLGELIIPPDANTNTVVGRVVLLPVPNTPDDGTPGHLGRR